MLRVLVFSSRQGLALLLSGCLFSGEILAGSVRLPPRPTPDRVPSRTGDVPEHPIGVTTVCAAPSPRHPVADALTVPPESGHAVGTQCGSAPPGEGASRDSASPLSDQTLLDDALAHVAAALEAYHGGDLPGTRFELETALDTLLAGNFPRGQEGLRYLQTKMPPGNQKKDLVTLYREVTRRVRFQEVTTIKRSGPGEKEVGGPQGLGQGGGPSPEEDPKAAPLARPASSSPEGNSASESLEYLSDTDREYVRREIERLVGAFGEKDYPHSRTFEQEVAYFIHSYQNGLRGFFERSLLRSVKYMPMVTGVLREKGVPDAMAYIAFVESGFRPTNVSSAGAVGLWQFMPRTGRAYGLKVDGQTDERTDPEKSTVAAREYFLDLVAIFGSGSFLLAMASYNAGEGKVQYCLKKVDDPFTQRTFWDIRTCLRKETREYVPRIVAAAIAAQAPSRFGFDQIAPYLDPKEFTLVDIPQPTSLTLLASLAGTSVAQLKDMNPDLGSKDTTSPRDVRGYRLLIPSKNAGVVQSELQIIADRKQEVQLLAAQPMSEGPSDHGAASAKAGKSRNDPVVLAEKSQEKKGTGKEGTGNEGSPKKAEGKTADPGAPVAKGPETSGGEGKESGQSSGKTPEKTSEESAGKAVARKAPSKEANSTGSAGEEGKPAVQGASEKSASEAKSGGDRPAVGAQKAGKAPQGSPEPVADKRTRYIRYQVQPGNTLARIAQDFGKPVEKLKAWNPYLKSRSLKPGDTVFVYDLDVSYKKVVHEVAPKETLSSLGTTYKVETDALKRWNGLTSTRLNPGQSLVIYTRGKAGSDLAKAEVSGAPVSRNGKEASTKGSKVGSKVGSRGGAKKVVYQVQAGNNLSMIAARFDCDIRDIMAWNGLQNGNLQVGQKLTLFPDKSLSKSD